jgi:FKBP-type peptidyl-prolyl cis-trans isomerase
MKKITSLLLIAILSIVTFSCKTYSEDQKTTFAQSALSLAKKNGWKVTQSESGLCVAQIKLGEGEETIVRESIVTLSYKGSLINGTVFDQTEPGKTMKANLKGLIGGFQEGLLGQKKGAKIRLIIPPNLGYGDQALEKIPANSLLLFEIEVVDFI